MDSASPPKDQPRAENTAASAQARITIRDKPALPPDEQAFQASLRPRRVPPKEPLHIPGGQQLRLIAKLADPLAARVRNDASLEVQTPDPKTIDGFRKLADQHRLEFRRVHSATDEQLQDLALRAARNTGEAQPDLAALVEVVPAVQTREAMIELAREIHALPEVEYAELESLDQPPPPPAADIAPVTPLLVSNQTYREAATGVAVDSVWNTYGIRGDAGLKITDCEYLFNVNHEDLSGLVQLQPNVVSMYTGFGDDHGTAVLGILASGWNGYGTTGSAPDCTTRFYPEFSTLTTGSQSRTAAVTAAIAASAAGDIVVLEMQTEGPATATGDYVPAEYSLSVWNAVRTGTDAGVITIAAAGNGNQNLDDNALFSAYNTRGDSGAIIVGAGTSARVKQGFSTYGSRVNVQGWGGGVFTTGYGSYATYGSDANQKYASGFSGTSSATPVVTSAAALLQSVAIKILGIRLTPAELRSILAATGRAQTGADAATKPIGPLPELQAAVAALFVAHPPTFQTLPNWGYYHFATPTPDLTADEDNDGAPALVEYVLGTDPNSKPAEDTARFPHLSLTTPAEGAPFATYEFSQPASRTGATWVVQQSTSLDPDSWQDLVHGVDDIAITRSGDTIQVTLPVTATKAYLRLKVTAH